LNRIRLSLPGGFLLLAGVAFLRTSSDAQVNTTRDIAKGVWFLEGDLSKGLCNNTIIEMKDYLVVIDANYPTGARLAMDAAKKLSPKPVKYVFDTHHHGDHAYGNAVWTASGARTMAYQGVADELKRYEPGRWKKETREDVKALNKDTAEPPQETFTKSPFILKDETREIAFYHFGWAHTRGDGFAWLPKERVMASGDAAVNGPYNYTADGNIGNWPVVTAAAAKLNPQFVLPGHGPSGGIEILDGQGRFFTELKKAVEAEIKAGKKIDQVSVNLPDSVKNWVGDGFKQQVKDTYNELTQKKPVGAIPHP
jgi:cyclase